MSEDHKDRYLLLCRHGRHMDGNLVPVKNVLERWEYPTDSVGRVLAEELAIRGEDIRLGKIVWADSNEAKQTAALLLNRLAGSAMKSSESAPTASYAKLHGLPALTEGEWAFLRWPSHLPEPTTNRHVSPRRVPCGEAAELSPVTDEAATRQMAAHEQGLIAQAFTEMSEPGITLSDQGTRVPERGNALLIVGHQPQLSQLTSVLTSRMWGLRRGAGLPLSPSEVLCLRCDGPSWKARWKLLWTVAPDDAGPLAELGDKVKGKMESAKLLSAVITLVLTALLATLLDTNRWNSLRDRRADLPGLDPYDAQMGATIAFVLLLIALALYLVTMYSYDRLLMPTRFWGESIGRLKRADTLSSWRRRRIPRRPPSSSAWVVYRNMQFIWFALFTPGNVLVALAFAVVAAPLLGVTEDVWWVALSIVVIVAFWAWWWRPVLGSED